MITWQVFSPIIHRFEQQMFFAESVYESVSEPAGESFLPTVAVTDLQPRHGCTWTSGRSFFYFPLLQKWHLPEHMQYREILRRKVSASFSTFWDRWISREDVVKWLRANSRLQFIPHAGMHRRESTIIIPMKTTRSLR